MYLCSHSYEQHWEHVILVLRFQLSHGVDGSTVVIPAELSKGMSSSTDCASSGCRSNPALGGLDVMALNLANVRKAFTSSSDIVGCSSWRLLLLYQASSRTPMYNSSNVRLNIPENNRFGLSMERERERERDRKSHLGQRPNNLLPIFLPERCGIRGKYLYTCGSPSLPCGPW